MMSFFPPSFSQPTCFYIFLFILVVQEYIFLDVGNVKFKLFYYYYYYYYYWREEGGGDDNVINNNKKKEYKYYYIR